MGAPTIADAERAAGALSALGARRVLVFGSVALGEARAGSDIDLVAVFDDLGDYRDRDKLGSEASRAARGASGHDCEVLVTDRPEWRVRAGLATSIESVLAKHAVVLVDLPPQQLIDWDKPIGKLATDLDLARNDVGGAQIAMIRASNQIDPGPEFDYVYAADDPNRWDEARFRRLQELCIHAHDAIRCAVWAYSRAIEGRYPHRGSDGDLITAAIEGLSEPARRSFIEAISPADPRDVAAWRLGADSPRPVREKLTPAFAADLFFAAKRCCVIAASAIADAHGPDGIENGLLREVEHASTLDETARRLRCDPPFARCTYDKLFLNAPQQAPLTPRIPQSHKLPASHRQSLRAAQTRRLLERVANMVTRWWRFALTWQPGRLR